MAAKKRRRKSTVKRTVKRHGRARTKRSKRTGRFIKS